MEVRGISCCGVRDMSGISEHKTPEAVLKNLGEKMFEEKRRCSSDYSYGPRVDPHWGSEGKTMYGHYIFTAVVRHTDGSQPPNKGEYGERLAAFIRQFQLGNVVESTEAPNRVNAPSHVIKVYVWTPNPRRFRAWYEVISGKRRKTAKRPAVSSL